LVGLLLLIQTLGVWKWNVKEEKMTLKEQQKQIDKLQLRIAELVDELRSTQADVKQFKTAVSRDIKRAYDAIQNNKK
jgi:molecular chaperone GrpE (heat shock protein)